MTEIKSEPKPLIVLKPFSSTVRRFRVSTKVEQPTTPEAVAEFAPHTFDDLVARKFIGEAPALPVAAAARRK